MKTFDTDPLGIIPKDFLLDGKIKLVKFQVPEDSSGPETYKITVRLSYGGETTRGYLYVLREYLNSLPL